MASSSSQCAGCGVVVETGVDVIIVVVWCRCERLRDADEVDNELDGHRYARASGGREITHVCRCARGGGHVLFAGAVVVLAITPLAPDIVSRVVVAVRFVCVSTMRLPRRSRYLKVRRRSACR